MPGPCPQARAHMFVHVNCSCSPLLSFVYARREPASPTVQRRRDLNVFPARSLHAKCLTRPNSCNQCASIAVTPSVFCKTSSRIRSTARRRSNGDVNELIPSVFYMLGTDGSHLQRRLSVSVPPCRSGVQTQPGGGSQKPRAVHASDEPTEIYINVLLVGIAGHTVISYALTVNGCHFMSRARIICFIEKNHLYHTRATQEGQRLRHCGAAWAWAGSGRTWLDNT